MIGLSSSVALTSTVGVTAASMDTALEAVAEDETETETETDSEEDVAEQSSEVGEAEAEEPGAGVNTILVNVIYMNEDGSTVKTARVVIADDNNDGVVSMDATSIEIPEGYELVSVEGESEIFGDAPYVYVTLKEKVQVPETKTIYVSYIDENGVPVDGAEIEQVTVPADELILMQAFLQKYQQAMSFVQQEIFSVQTIQLM